MHVKADGTRASNQTPSFSRSGSPTFPSIQQLARLCAARHINRKMLSSEHILEEAARDGSIDMFVPPFALRPARS